MLNDIDIKFFKLAVGSSNIGKESAVDITARCPICGDSSVKRNSKRLHLYEKNGVTNLNCFNGDCSCVNKTMYGFLNEFYPELLPQYKRETFNTTLNKLNKQDVASNIESVFASIKKEKPVVTQDLSSFMVELSFSNEGLYYLKKRGIDYDPDLFGRWYFGTQNLKINDTLYTIHNSIIIPLYYEKEMYGFYSRSINSKNFITYNNENNIGYKVWNWFNINKNEPVYICEGIFDAISSGHKNIIALMGAKLPEDRLNELKHPVFVLDNDRTGKINSIEYAKKGYKVYIQPKNIIEKDFNELKLKHPELDLKKLINDNLYTGIKAEILLKGTL